MKPLLQRLLQPSIARRITAALLLAFACLWGSLYLLGHLGVEAESVGNFDREMRIVAAAALQVIDGPTQPQDLRLALGGLAAYLQANARTHGVPDGFMAYRVTARDGTVLADSGSGPSAWPPADDRRGFFMHHAASGAYRMYRAAAKDGRVLIDVSSSQRSRQRVWNGVMLSAGALWPLLYGFPLLLLPAWLAVHTGLSPLRRLSAELATRTPDDLTPIRIPPVYRELAPLARELNGALSRLAALLRRERDFLADAAHQLRTPLALISAQCDTLANAPPGPARQAALQRLQGGLQRANRMVNQLLALARLEANLEDVPVTTDIADVARDALAAHGSLARAQGIELCYAGPDSLVRTCPGHAVESIIDNLVANAVRYGRPGGQVELRLDAPDGGPLQIQVSDDGPGIAAQDRSMVFERFRRGADPGATGSGLGLAIVSAAARQWGARVDLLPGLAGRGIAFRVTWPGATP